VWGISGLVADVDDSAVAGRRVGRRLGAGGLVLVVVVADVVAVASASRRFAGEPLCGAKAASVLVTGPRALKTLSEDVGGETRVVPADGTS